MKRFVFLLMVVAGLSSPSWAARQVSVAQLNQWLAGVQGQSDDKVAKELDGMVLTEPVSPGQLTRWEAQLPGRRSLEALTKLADYSAFLDPPATEMLADAPPDDQAQGAILSSANDYILQTLAKLPDFYATRTAERFEGLSVERESGSMAFSVYSKSEYVQLLPGGKSVVPVSYRDGVEMQGSRKMNGTMVAQPAPGLTTWGEFGPILSTVLNDARHGAITWGYWERGARSKVAVFRYKVPENRSHYVVTQELVGRDAKFFPAYHGEIAIDPASGAILRITIFVGSLAPSSGIRENDVAVDYSPVLLGAKTYICPVKGVALLRGVAPQEQGAAALLTSLNDITFSGYHLMRGDITILPAQP